MGYTNTKLKNTIIRYNSLFKKIIIISIGSVIYSCGIAIFMTPNNIAPGGIMGLAIILSYISGYDIGNIYFILNIPIIIAGIKVLGKRFVLLSLEAIIISSIISSKLDFITVQSSELILPVIAGGIFIGIGLGLVLRYDASTGGMDIIVKIIHYYIPSIKISICFMVADIAVVITSGIIYDNFDIAMYAFISIVISGKMLDYMLYGSDEAKLIFIITEKKEKMVQSIINELSISATILEGTGAYSGNSKNIVLCVVKKRYTPKLEEIVKNTDIKSFMIITKANEIYGLGYKNIQMQER